MDKTPLWATSAAGPIRPTPSAAGTHGSQHTSVLDDHGTLELAESPATRALVDVVQAQQVALGPLAVQHHGVVWGQNNARKEKNTRSGRPEHRKRSRGGRRPLAKWGGRRPKTWPGRHMPQSRIWSQTVPSVRYSAFSARTRWASLYLENSFSGSPMIRRRRDLSAPTVSPCENTPVDSGQRRTASVLPPHPPTTPKKSLSCVAPRNARV